MMNDDFESEYFFDVNDYLLESYPLMSLPDRRAICAIALREIEEENLQEQVDGVIWQYSLEKLKFLAPPTDEKDESD